MKKVLILLFSALVLSSFVVFEKEKSINDFRLKNALNSKFVSLSDYKNAKGFVVVFTCNKCPMAKFKANNGIPDFLYFKFISFNRFV